MNPNIERRYGWLLLILLTAVFLRLYAITDVPPGLTHDEADHGITAWEVVKGIRQIYFTIGYGREPLFDYTTASLMAFLGPTFLAGRLTAVFFSLIMITGTYAWVRLAFDQKTALLTVAGLALSFWPLMTARQSLRSGALPALFVLAIYLFTRGMNMPNRRTNFLCRSSLVYFLATGLILGITFYIYIPARILWLTFPLTAGYLMLVSRLSLRRIWRGVVLLLLVALIVGSPLFYYLNSHPEAELRITQLSAPLNAFLAGDSAPLFKNVVASLGLFTFSGDSYWRYNIPGRPFFQPVMGLFFYLGILAALWHLFGPTAEKQNQIPYFIALIWLLLGMTPVLIIGPDLSTTQAIGMQPVLFLFPALGLTTTVSNFERWRLLDKWSSSNIRRRLAIMALMILFASTAVFTARDYFVTWARDPEVRVQYESTLVTAIDYLNQYGKGTYAVSTIAPDQFHSPAVARMTLRNDSVSLRWFDGRSSLVLPDAELSHIIIPGFTPIAPALAKYFDAVVLAETIPLPTTDLDQPLTVYRLNGPVLSAEWQEQLKTDMDQLAAPVNFGDIVDFLGYDLQTPNVKPGEQLQLVTLWQVRKPLANMTLFTHLQGEGGMPIAQVDQLDVPGESWYQGDQFIQLHQFQVPQETVSGEYPLVIGVCQKNLQGCSRLPFFGNMEQDDLLFLTMLNVTQ